MSKNPSGNLFNNVIPLSWDNFTPLKRTPWAGTKLYENFKQHLGGNEPQLVGESWEFSCDPAFPSTILGDQATLAELIAEHPLSSLPPHIGACEILVKLICAATPLSVQVHPDDQGRFLKESECGKPESWLILDTEPGQGIYLGFKQELTKAQLKDLLLSRVDLQPYLQFVEAKPYDYFEISPGDVHAIGPGVMILEPQKIQWGKSGKTYRLWDWGRKYNAEGAYDEMHGKPRELHIDESLDVIDPAEQLGERILEKMRREPKLHELSAAVLVREYPENAYYQTTHVTSDTNAVDLSIQNGYGALTVLKGSAEIIGAKNSVIQLHKGQTAFIPYSLNKFTAVASADSEFSLVISAGAQTKVSL
jgi:mannose-6-phosphate isomerase class I